MKHLLRVLLVLSFLFLLTISVANPVPMTPPIVNELLFTTTGWQLELYPVPSGSLDGLWIHTQTDSAQTIPGLRSVNDMAVLTIDSLRTPLGINQDGDCLTLTLDGVPFEPFTFGTTGPFIEAPPSGVSISRFVEYIRYYLDKSPTIGAQNDTTNAQGWIISTVCNAAGAPVPGAAIYCDGATSPKTDSLGMFTAHALASRISACVMATNYLTLWKTIQVHPDEVDSIVFVLTPRVGIVENGDGIPSSFRLLPNYPNPFNAQTIFTIDLPVEDHLTLELFDMKGERVELIVSERRGPGTYRISWDGAYQAAGIYFLRAITSANQAVQKIVLLK